MKLAVHIINGLIILILTIIMSLKVIDYFDGELRWEDSLHSAVGLGVFFAVLFIVFLGFLTWMA
jgi:hypothetical protein